MKEVFLICEGILKIVMIQTTIIPDNTILNINIPKNYVGKKVYALFYIEEEITPNVELNFVHKSSDFSEIAGFDEKEKNQLNAGRKSLKISDLVESLTGVIPNTALKNDDYYEYLTKKHS